MSHSKSELTEAIDEFILNERNRKVIKRKLIDDIPYERLAEEFDLSVRWTKEIVSRGKAILKRHL